MVSEGIGLTGETESVLMVSDMTVSVVTLVSVLDSFLQLRTIIAISRLDIIIFIILYFVVIVQR
jgi:hypothetical protein